MISFDQPAALAPSDERKVLILSAVAWGAVPLGWSLAYLAADFRSTLGLVGTLLVLLGLGASLLLLPTGTQRLASGAADGLDERQLQVRYEAQARAYRAISGWILLMALLFEILPPLTGIELSSAHPAMILFPAWALAWIIMMPSYFLARASSTARPVEPHGE